MDVAHIGCWLQDEACEVNVLRVVRFLRVWQKLLMWLDGCKIGLTVESEEGEVPHLRWSQAPPLPWRRPGSADIIEGFKNGHIPQKNAFLYMDKHKCPLEFVVTHFQAKLLTDW